MPDSQMSREAACGGLHTAEQSNVRLIMAHSLAGFDYTGIGSRKTPANVLKLMQAIGFRLGSLGIRLRSGGAEGADSAFEVGARRAITEHHGPEPLIFLPYPGFRGKSRITFAPNSQIHKEATRIIRDLHPAWDRCSDFAKKAHTRNAFQILGSDLRKPSQFLVFYAEVSRGEIQGGTRTAVILAKKLQIPCFNLFYSSTKPELKAFLGID
jgi:hypothetical protein